LKLPGCCILRGPNVESLAHYVIRYQLKQGQRINGGTRL
jgi:hypothetical protein